MEEVSLREYIEVMLRWKWLIGGLTAVAILAAALASFVMITPTYEAKAVFSLEVPDYKLGEAANAAIRQIGLVNVGPGAVLNSLNRDDFLQGVQDRLGAEAEAVARLRRKLAIEAGKDNTSYTVTARDNDPQRAQALANAVVEELKDFVSQLGEQGMDHGLQALEGQRREAEQALAAARAELARTEGLLAGTPDKVVLQKALLAPDGSALVPVEEEAVNPAYQALQERVSELSGRVAGLAAEQEALAGVLAQQTGRLAELNLRIEERSQARGSLEEKVARRKQVLDALAEQINQLRIARAVGGQVPLVKVLAPAGLPESPVSPRGALNVAVAAVLGLMVSVFLAFFLEYWRTSGGEGLTSGA